MSADRYDMVLGLITSAMAVLFLMSTVCFALVGAVRKNLRLQDRVAAQADEIKQLRASRRVVVDELLARNGEMRAVQRDLGSKGMSGWVEGQIAPQATFHGVSRYKDAQDRAWNEARLRPWTPDGMY